MNLLDVHNLINKGAVQLLIRKQFHKLQSTYFPPTYAPDPSGRIDPANPGNYTLNNGGVTLDSVGSRANRIEARLLELGQKDPIIPRVTITKDGEARDLFVLGHRLADGAVRGSTLAPEAEEVFKMFA